MLATYRAIYSRSLVNPLTRSRFNINIQFFRLLISDIDLKINQFLDFRNDKQKKLGNRKDEFINKIEENAADPDSKVFGQDLSFFIAVADTDNDLNTLVNLTKKNFLMSVGPVMMRLFHIKRKPGLALKLFNDEKLQSCFMFQSSLKVLMDLLYECGQYDDAIQVFQFYCNYLMMKGNFIYPTLPSVIAFACFARLNTKESLKKAKELYENYHKNGKHMPYTESLVNLAYLAVQQQDFEFSLEVISNQKLGHLTNFTPTTNIKILALLGLHRYEDALNLLYEKRGPICVDVVEEIQLRLQVVNDAHLKGCMHFIETQTPYFSRNNNREDRLAIRVFAQVDPK